MSINWFPGHMNKARKQLQERAAKSDMLIEVLDARLPRSSQNPMLSKWCRGLPVLRVLTKADLADPAITAEWLVELTGEQAHCMELVATEPRNAKRLIKACRDLVPKRGKPGFPVRVMIGGIPNVGKSSIFNMLAGKRKAAVRDQPAVTRMEQRIDVPGGLSLIDTPGVLWPKLDDQVGANRLACSGAIRETAYDALDVARFAVEWLRKEHPERLRRRFKLDRLAPQADALLEQIANKRGCLTRGVGPDLVKVSELLLVELRAAKFGRISFEAPADFRRRDAADEAPTSSPEAEGSPLE